MNDELVEFASGLARDTGRLLLGFFGRTDLDPQRKADRSLVSEADVAADRHIAAALAERVPGEGVLSEELNPGYGYDGSALWVVDPLDGTTNFLYGLAHWGVSIARLVDGVPVLGALYFPVLDELYVAARGAGAYRNGKRLRLAEMKEDASGFLCCCSRTAGRFEVTIPLKKRTLGSAAYGLCAVAAGSAAITIETTPKVWDLAAGWVVVEEAGGLVETIDGTPPFPLLRGVDYAEKGFATLAVRSPKLMEMARSNLRPLDRVPQG